MGESAEKYVTLTVPIEKEVTRIDKNGEEFAKNISCILQLIDNAKSMTSSLSDLVGNLSEGIHKIKYKYRHDGKKCETFGILRLFFLNMQTLKLI